MSVVAPPNFTVSTLGYVPARRNMIIMIKEDTGWTKATVIKKINGGVFNVCFDNFWLHERSLTEENYSSNMNAGAGSWVLLRPQRVARRGAVQYSR